MNCVIDSTGTDAPTDARSAGAHAPADRRDPAGTRRPGARRRTVRLALTCAALPLLLPVAAHAEGTSLSVSGGSAALGPFVPGIATTYGTSITASVSADEPGATLTAMDPTATSAAHLTNDTFPLAHPLEARATSDAATGGPFAPVGGTAAPLTLLTYALPVSDDTATISFRQAVDATEPLRTGTYGTTLILTLSTGTP